MIIHNVGQRSSEWFKLRLGKVTGSNAHNLTTSTKFESYYHELLAETITRNITEGHVTEQMQWGIDNEPFAAEWYMNYTKQDIEVCGFIEDENNIFGCSPDLLVGEKGMAQIKCPSSKKHMHYRDTDLTKSKDIKDKEIYIQIQWEMFIAEREWSDFISYDPRFERIKPELMGHIQRIYRDEKIITKLVTSAKEMQSKIHMFLFDNGIPFSRYIPPIPPPIGEDDLAMYLRA
jgi:putative phage-type endonuclease